LIFQYYGVYWYKKEIFVPKWLIDALKNQKLSKEEVSSVYDKVIMVGRQHDRQAERIEITEQDRHRRYNI
jgi:hypothetical protein